MKVIIDAGHGGNDPGAINTDRQEKTDNLRFAFALGGTLERMGILVNYTRTADYSLTLQSRCDIANTWNADLFISCHRNGHDDKTAHGYETWANESATLTSKVLAELIQEKLVTNGVTKDRKTKVNGNFHVLNNIKNMDGVLLELGFITNNNDNIFFDMNLFKHVDAVADAVCEFYNIKQPEEKETVTVQKDFLRGLYDLIKQAQAKLTELI